MRITESRLRKTIRKTIKKFHASVMSESAVRRIINSLLQEGSSKEQIKGSISDPEIKKDPDRLDAIADLIYTSREFFRKNFEAGLGSSSQFRGNVDWSRVQAGQFLSLAISDLLAGKKSMAANLLLQAADKTGFDKQQFFQGGVRYPFSQWVNDVRNVNMSGSDSKQNELWLTQYIRSKDTSAENIRKFTNWFVPWSDTFIDMMKVYKGLLDKHAELRNTTDPELKATTYKKFPADAPLGSYAFSPQRQKTGRFAPPMEPNTELENSLLSELEEHMLGKTPLSAEAANQIKSFVRQGLYTDVFGDCSEYSVAYRGMAVDEKYIKNVLGLSPEELASNNPSPKNPLEIDGNWTFQPQSGSGASSWSLNWRASMHFAEMGKRGGKYIFSIVMEAPISENSGSFIDVSEFTDNVALKRKDMSMLREEMEAIGLGNIKFNKVYITMIRKK